MPLGIVVVKHKKSCQSFLQPRVFQEAPWDIPAVIPPEVSVGISLGFFAGITFRIPAASSNYSRNNHWTLDHSLIFIKFLVKKKEKHSNFLSSECESFYACSLCVARTVTHEIPSARFSPFVFRAKIMTDLSFARQQKRQFVLEFVWQVWVCACTIERKFLKCCWPMRRESSLNRASEAKPSRQHHQGKEEEKP